MSHEQSETIERSGRWFNIYGKETPKAGQDLPLMFPWEQPSYATEPEASAAARRRSNEYRPGPKITWDDERTPGPLNPAAPGTPPITWGEAPGPPSAPTPPTGPLSRLSQTLTAPVRGLFQKAGEWDVQAGIKTPQQAASRSETYSKLIVPQTGTDWALAGAFPAARGVAQASKLGPMLQRLLTGGLVTGAGAGASAAETGDPWRGAAQGAAGSLLGTVPAVGGATIRATPWGRRRVLQAMEREVLEEMGTAAPAFKGVVPGTAYERLVVFPRGLQQKFSEAFEAGIARTSHLAPGKSVTSPTLQNVWERLPKKAPGEMDIWARLTPDANGKFTVEQAQELLQIARAGAYRGTRLMTEKATKASAIQAYQKAREEVYTSLPKEAAEVLEQTRILHGVNKGLAAIFKEGGVLKPGLGGPVLDPNAALQYMERAGDQLRRKVGDDIFRVLHGALSRGGKLGERHDLGTKELIPGILERSVVIIRSLLKHIGMTPMKLGGTRPQPFTSPTLETATGFLGSQAAGRALPRQTAPTR